MDAHDIERIAAAYTDETDPTIRDGWAIQDIGSLEWAMSRVADLEAEARENEAALTAAHAALDRRAAQLEAQVQRGIAFFRSNILSYMEAHRAELLKGGKRKSRTMLYGTIGWKAPRARLKVLDRDALTAWAETQPVQYGLVRIKTEPALDPINDYCAERNMVPPGTELELPEDRPFIKALSPGTTLVKTEGQNDDDEP